MTGGQLKRESNKRKCSKCDNLLSEYASEWDVLCDEHFILALDAIISIIPALVENAKKEQEAAILSLLEKTDET